MSGNKYGAVTVERDGYRFASKAEARRYETLRMLALAGEIRNVVVHPRFALYAPILREDSLPVSADDAPALLPLCPGEYGPSCFARRIGYYTADFAYVRKDGAPVVEDVKGGRATRTEAYRLRKKIVEAFYGLTIEEVQ